MSIEAEEKKQKAENRLKTATFSFRASEGEYYEALADAYDHGLTARRMHEITGRSYGSIHKTAQRASAKRKKTGKAH